jgi:Calpain family cysteine protease
MEACIEAIPLTAHAAATTARNADPFLAETQENGTNGSNANAWMATTTAHALRDVPYDYYLGLRFYHRDPLPFLLEEVEADEQGRLFVDHEFPVHSQVLVNATPSQQFILQPGIITSSNCRDFAHAGGRKTRRAGQYCRLAAGHYWKRKGATGPLFLQVSADVVVQGAIGNCGLCSGFASLADQWPEYIREAFGKYSQEGLLRCGAYSVRLYPQGVERFLLLDDYLLCDDKNMPPSIRSRGGDTWPEYLEKVIVKIQGSYASLDGLYKFNSLYKHPARALGLLTSAPFSLEVHYEHHQQNAVYEVLMASQGECARVVHCRWRLHGLHANHGYSLLWVGSVGQQRLVCLRNPHGKGSYTGKFGWGWSGWRAGDSSAMVDELVQLGCFQRCTSIGQPLWRGKEAGTRTPNPSARSGTTDSHDNVVGGMPQLGDNGVFLMEFSVFIECFPITTMVGPIFRDRRKGCSEVQTLNKTLSGQPNCIFKSKPEQLGSVETILRQALKRF